MLFVLALHCQAARIAVSNAVAFLNMLGVTNPFGLVCLVTVFRRSGLTVESWSRLSGRCCPRWSGWVLTVLVWSSWYTWSGMISFPLFCLFSLHRFGRGCSVPGRCLAVELTLVLVALVRPASVLLWSSLLYSRLVCSRLFAWCVLLYGLV